MKIIKTVNIADICNINDVLEEVHGLVRDAGLVLIAGGHVAVLLNRIRLFGLDKLLAKKPVPLLGAIRQIGGIIIAQSVLGGFSQQLQGQQARTGLTGTEFNHIRRQI